MSSTRTWSVVFRAVPFVFCGVVLLVYGLSSSFREETNTSVGMLARGDLDGLRDWARGYGALAPLVTSGLMIVQGIAAPIPAVLITITNSVLFGPFWGAVVSIVSANVAALLCFGIGRWLCVVVVRRLIGEEAARETEGFVEEHGTAAVLVARLLPFVPFDPISYVAGMSSMRAWPFFWATLVGQIPAGFVYSYLATDLTEALAGAERSLGIVLFQVIAAFAALCVFGWAVRHWLLQRGRDERYSDDSFEG